MPQITKPVNEDHFFNISLDSAEHSKTLDKESCVTFEEILDEEESFTFEVSGIYCMPSVFRPFYFRKCAGHVFNARNSLLLLN